MEYLILIKFQEKVVWFSDKNDMSFRFLAEANIKSKRVLETYFKCIFGIYFGLFVCGTLGSVTLCIYKFGRFERKHVYVPYKSV